MKGITLVYIAISVFAFSNRHPAWGHGVLLRFIETVNSVCLVQGEFTDGSPMSYAEVTIKHTDPPYILQKGFSDKNGRFSFIPDANGTWQVIFQDGMGHRCELNIRASRCQSLYHGPKEGDGTLEKTGHNLNVLNRSGLLLKTAVGLLAIAGIHSLLTQVLQRRYSRKARYHKKG